MSKQYDLAVYIGRFQPFHAGHSTTLRQAIEIAKEVLVLVGSSGKAPDVKNPFTFEERSQMISNSCAGKVFIRPLVDHTYSNNTWIEQVQGIVYDLCLDQNLDKKKIVLVGHNKEDTFYLDFFPQWAYHNAINFRGIEATKIRDRYFSGHLDWEIDDVVTKATYEFLNEFRKTDRYETLCKEHEFLKAYKKQFEVYPYPPYFVTVDAVVVNRGHVLVVKRKSHPGKGLWALPGGFLNHDEWIVDGIVRELREETSIKIHEKFLKSAIVQVKVFDAPNRSLRGRTITHAGLIVLHEDSQFVKVKGSDDAEHAKWMPIAEIRQNPEWFFEDHFSIINAMLQLTVDRPQGY